MVAANKKKVRTWGRYGPKMKHSSHTLQDIATFNIPQCKEKDKQKEPFPNDSFHPTL